MFRAGMESIFTGEAGAVTYLLFVMMISIASIGRVYALNRKSFNSRLGGVSAGFLLLAVSRALYVSKFYTGHAGYTTAFLILGFAGFYMLMTTAASGRREGDYSSWNARLVACALAAGMVPGGLATMLLDGRAAGSVGETLFFSFMAFAPAGLLVGLVWEKGKLKSKTPVMILVSAAFIAAASVMSSLQLSGLVSQDMFWMQLFSVLDVTGLFIFLTAFVLETNPSAEDAAGGSSPDAVASREGFRSVSGEGVPGSEAVEISMDIISGERDKFVYRKIAEAAMNESGAKFILVRTLNASEDVFDTRAFALQGAGETTPVFSARLKKSELFDLFDGNKISGGRSFSREQLGEYYGSVVPENLEGEDITVDIFPVNDNGVLKGFITAGFSAETYSAEALEILRIYSYSMLEIAAREEFKDRIRSGKKALALCKEELDAANQLKSNFLSIVSHELRTPLTSIKAYSETLLDNIGTIERDTIKNFLSVMGEENDRVIKLVDNMLSYSSMETGHLKVEKTACNLNRMIRDSLSDLEKAFLDRKVNTDLRLPKHDVIIEADSELIQQLLQNLVSNAVKFTPEMGKVSISLEEEASAARIVIQDTGNGIPEDQLEKIFDRFHQVDASDTREFGGSGLGLAICKNIVEWHDGTIWVENVKEAGAKFVVMLPMKDIIVRQATTTGQIGSVRFERERYLSLLVEMLSEFLQARKASIMTLDPDKRTLRIIAAKGLDPEFVQNTNLELGDRIAGKVFLEGEPIHVFDIEKDDFVGRANNSAYYGTHSFISAPLMDGDNTIGVLNVSDNVNGREFTKADMEILQSLGVIIAGMLKKLDAFETVSSNFEKLKTAMKSILHIREWWGSKNLLNYTLIALAVGKRLGLPEESMTALRMGMNVYDLGMMKIPRNIRVKKEELGEREWKKLHEHPELGYMLLSPMGLDEKIMKMVRYHHEYYDGSGYPEGLVREEIPVEARIINVIDSFRALITHGPYRRAFSIDEARNEIIKNSGTKFDPKVVGAFVKVLHELGARDDEQDMVLDVVEQELDQIRKENEESVDDTILRGEKTGRS